MHADAPHRPVGSRWRTVGDQAALWLAAAVLAATLHLLTARVLGLGYSVLRWGWESRDLTWRIPLGYLAVFLPLGLVLGAVAIGLGGSRGFRFVAWAWITLVLFSVLLLFPQIHGYAWLVLAAGVALQLLPLVVRHERAVLRGARWVGTIGATLAIAGAVLVPRLRESRERETIAGLPATPVGAPSVLLLILDTVRADDLTAYGASDSTSPRLAAWARQGVLFEQAYSTSSWTTPSHASLFTGQYPGVHGADFDVALAPEFLTLAEHLQEEGWATGGFTANLMATPIESGLAQGFIRYEDLQNSAEEVLKSTTLTQSHNVLRFWATLRDGNGLGQAVRAFLRTDFTPRLEEDAHDNKTAAEVRSSFTRWLDGVPAERPFFAFLNVFDAHAPYTPPRPYLTMFNEGRRAHDRYRGALRYLDDEVAGLLADLERLGRLENTIVVVTSDHGEQFGEHGLETHANSLYRQVLQVPLVVVAPGRVPAGLRLAHQVSGRDVPATILELAGVAGDPRIGGRSLGALWRDSTSRPSDVLAEVSQNMRPQLRFPNSLGPMKALVGDSLHVIRDGAGALEVYRYRVDVAELDDLVAAGGDTTGFAAVLDAAIARHQLAWPVAVPRSRAAADTGGPGR